MAQINNMFCKMTMMFPPTLVKNFNEGKIVPSCYARPQQSVDPIQDISPTSLTPYYLLLAYFPVLCGYLPFAFFCSFAVHC